MLKFIALFLLTTSFSFASIPKVRARNVSCEELKNMFASYHEVYVVYGLLGISRATFWESKRDARMSCSGDQIVQAETFSTTDGACQVGYGCTSPFGHRH